MNIRRDAAVRADKFAIEYAKDRNGTRAYRAVFPGCKSDKAAAVGASQLLKNPNVVSKVEQIEKRAGEVAEIDVARLLKESERLAFVDIRKLFNKDGTPKQPHELDDDTAAALGGIERVQEGTGRTKVVTWRYKVLDKNSTHERLFKHKGLFAKDNEQAADAVVRAANAFVERVSGKSRDLPSEPRRADGK